MMKSIVFVALLFIAEMAATHQSKGICCRIYEFCLEELNGSRDEPIPVSTRRGKAGPRGHPCLEATVNYTKIEVKMQRMLDDKFDILQKKIEEYDSLIAEKRAEAKGYVLPRGCYDVHKLQAKSWDGVGGLFDVYSNRTGEPVEVYCKLVADNGWKVFQRRMDGSVDFYRTWEEYASGFGNESGEFWLGLENIHAMTKVGRYELRIDMEDWSGNTVYAHYGTFSVGDRDSKFQLTISDYSGNAGDSLAIHNKMRFTTKDLDYDGYSSNNCAVMYKGAWWYNQCHHSNLNGNYIKGGSAPYGIGIVWNAWKGYRYSLKYTEMKFRKVD